jgi:methyl-accepting chemotaxis protein
VTQQNAAMVEEATAAARSLAEETEKMSRQIGRFRLASRTAPSSAATVVHRLQSRAAQAGARIAANTRSGRASLAPAAANEEDWSQF